MLYELQPMPVKTISQSRILLLQSYFGVGVMDEKFTSYLEGILEKLDKVHSTPWEKYLLKVAFQSKIFLFFTDIWTRLFKKSHPLRSVLNSFLALYECSPSYALKTRLQKEGSFFNFLIMIFLYFISLPVVFVGMGFVYLFFLICQISK